MNPMNISPERLTALEGFMREISAYKGRGANMRCAVSYASAWLRGERTRAQLLYTRYNMSGWRSHRAGYVRDQIDSIIDDTRLQGEK